MDWKKIVKRLTAHTLTSAALGAATNAIGASVLNAAGHKGHDIAESAAVASTGAALVGAIFELWCCYPEFMNLRGEVAFRLMWSYLFSQLLGPIFGKNLLANSEFSTMSLEQYWSDTAIGMAIDIIPFCLVLCCIVGNSELEPEPQANAMEEDAEAGANIEGVYQLLDVEPPQALNPAQFVPFETLRDRLDKCYKGYIPEDYLDPVSQTLMNDPVSVHCGHNYDRENLPELEEKCESCPLCKAKFIDTDFSRPTPNIFYEAQL